MENDVEDPVSAKMKVSKKCGTTAMKGNQRLWFHLFINVVQTISKDIIDLMETSHDKIHSYIGTSTKKGNPTNLGN